jgi:ribosomal protein L11 methyltransferase
MVIMPNESAELIPWLEVRIRADDSPQAKALARRMRKFGAVQVMLMEREVWSLWPDGNETAAALEQITASQPGLSLHCRRQQAKGPLELWRRPAAEPVGPGLFLAPAWMGCKAGPDTLVIDALTAFGGGDHASTRLNLNLICRICQEPLPRGIWLADVGSGTGVLALALALKTGRRVMAVDPDPAAGRALARNQRLNPLAGPLVSFALATHAALAGPFALAAANLPEPILRVAAQHLASRLAAGGWLVVSGFRAEAREDLIAFMAELGLQLWHSRQSEGWSGLALQKDAA